MTFSTKRSGGKTSREARKNVSTESPETWGKHRDRKQ